MECVEAALKTSFRKDLGVKSSNHQVLLEDLCAANAQNVVSCDDFFVDDLLDLSNDDAFVEKETHPELEPETKKLKQQDVKKLEENDVNLLSKDDFGALPATELTVPAEDLASLEWLSHFVEDSFSEFSAAPFLTGVTPERPMKMIEVQPKQEPPFKTPVPAKARSKRTRTGGRVWSLGSPSLTESSSSSTTSSSSCSSQSSPWLIYAHPSLSMDRVYPVEPRAGKKPKKAGTETIAQPPRRCSHCGVQKTPQWRTGPLGAKTLCNACGVRFKSGRLLPEYRPACSPTFSSDLHSNHHRKVLEMRRKKETVPRPDSGLGPQPVPSF